jgi:diguanylate cyclase (GGDEF)-like protein/PAS domain S-box-containing protein
MSGSGVRLRPRRALPFVAAGVPALLYVLAWLVIGPDGLSSWAPVAAGAAAAGSLFYAGRRRSGADRINRAMWRCFGIAAVSWCAGAMINAISTIVLSRAVVALSVADVFILAAMVALATGFVMPIRLPRLAGTWVRYAADTYVCMSALFVLGWVVLFAQLYHLSGESAAEFVIELLYPLVDTVLVCAALPFVLGTRPGHRRSAVLAYVALLAIAVADVVATAVRLRNGSSPGDVSDVARFVGLLLLGVLPWIERGDPRADADSDDADPLGNIVGPGIATAAASGAAALFIAGRSLTDGHSLEPVVSVVAGSATLILLVRLAGLLRENDRLQRAVDTGEEHFRALAESINDVVLICDLDGSVQYVSAGAQRTFSYAPDELLGRPLQEIVHPEDLPKVEGIFTEFLGGEQEVLRLACRIRAADGTWLPTESTISHYARSTDESRGTLLVTARDLSEQAALQRQVTHLTFHDGQTGLPNRAYFEERAREVLSRQGQAATAPSGPVAVLFADIDGFTAVNDSAGHAAGDQVLTQAARRLRAAVQADDTVARWGGDEFAVLVQNVAEGQAVVDLAERLLRALSEEPYRVGSRGIALTASVGVAFAEDELGSPELIRNGDLAMARAKELGGGRVEVFAAHMHADVVRRLELSGDLQRALAEEQFAVEFQPVVDLTTSRVTGVEALVRWWRAGVSVPPEEFIGPAEESGLMVPLGNWVLREACREVAGWRQGSWEMGLSVNFTARQIAAPRFVESVAAALDETGLPPHALTLEVTEEVLVEDAGHNVERLSALRELGVRLAIDDFGTGYASLAYLGQLPVDIIKIDPSFVAGLGRDETRTLLTRTIVRLGHDLGLIVVAEGIERPEQLELLREMGCPRGQGFLVARPMAPGRVEALVRTSLSGGGLPLQGSAVSAG